MRRTLKRVLALALGLTLIYGAVCAFYAVRAYLFRRHPQRSVAVSLFGGDLPHKVLARAIIFKRGTESYNSDLMEWAFRSKRLSDSSWNRWILERHIEKTPEASRAELLTHYPLRPTSRLMPFYRAALELNLHEVLPVLDRADTEEGPALARDWVRRSLIEARDPGLFLTAFHSLADSSAAPFPEVLRHYWPRLSPAQRRRVMAKLAAHATLAPGRSDELFEWMRLALAAGEVKLDCAGLAVLSRLAATGDRTAQIAETLRRHGDQIDPAHVPMLFRALDFEAVLPLATAAFAELQKVNTQAALRVFRRAAEADITEAEALAADILASRDSELRKGVIVLLVRNDSVRARAMIDESFKGEAPRRTFFGRPHDYYNGSEAGDAYRALSTHDFSETGKTWPAAYLRGGPSPDEATGWRRFIDTYPWFPSTDDAYYRLAFSQFAQKDYAGCSATINEYIRRPYWPDNDAQPYVMHLFRRLLVASDPALSDQPFAAHLRNITSRPLGGMIMGPRDGVDSVINSIDWFLAHPEDAVYLNADVPTLRVMREAAVIIRDSPPDSTGRLLAALLEGGHRPEPEGAGTGGGGESAAGGAGSDHHSDAVEGEGDVYDIDHAADAVVEECADASRDDETFDYKRAGLASAVLYGVFLKAAPPPPGALRVELPPDPAEEAIRRMASYLNERFSAASLEDARARRLDDLVVLALLHAGHDFEEWQGDFAPTLRFVASLDKRDVPGVVAKRHQGLVSRNEE